MYELVNTWRIGEHAKVYLKLCVFALQRPNVTFRIAQISVHSL